MKPGRTPQAPTKDRANQDAGAAAHKGAGPAPKAKTDGKAAKSGGAHASKTRKKDRDEAPASPGPLDQAPRQQPHKGEIHLDRRSFNVGVEAAGFDAPLAIETPPAAEPKSGAAAPQAGPDYRSLYAEAAGTGLSLYRRMIDEARRIVGDAERRDRELAQLHQESLTTSLRALDQGLDQSLASLTAGSDWLHLTLNSTADQLRAQIREAAEGAIKQLGGRVAEFQSKLRPLRGKRDTINEDAKQGQSAVAEQAANADSSLNSFAGNVAGAFPDIFNPVQRAVRDAKVDFVPGYIALARASIKESAGKFDEFLTKSFKCLPCEFENAFHSLEGQVGMMQTAGPKAVHAARDGALKSVDAAIIPLTQAIDANRRATEEALIAQHERTRESLVEISQGNGDREAQSVADNAERQSLALVGMASGQPTAVRQAHASILAQQAGPNQFPQLAAQASARLKANLDGIGAKQPRASADAAARLGDSQRDRARQFEDQQQKVVRGTGDALVEIVHQSVNRVHGQISDTLSGLNHLPDDVAASCKAYLAPAGKALSDSAAALEKSINATGRQVQQALNGGSAEPEEDDKKGKSDKQDADKTKKGKKADEKAEAPPCVCSNDMDDKGGKPDGDGAKDTDASKPKDAAKPDPSAAPDASTPNGFKALCMRIRDDPKVASEIASFLASVPKTVTDKLGTRVGEVAGALATTFSPDTNRLMAALRGLSAHQGDAISYLYNRDHSPDLEEKIRQKFLEDSVLSAGSTDQANYDGAINALHGHATEGAMSELVAAFNYSNEDQRIRDVLLALTPMQLAELKANHAKDLEELSKQLDGDDLVIFNQLLAGKTAFAKANSLREQIDTVNRSETGKKRGDAIAEKLTAASTDFHSALEGDDKREQADIFGLEAQSKAVKDRNAAHWKDVQSAFGQLSQVKETLGPHSDPDKAILTYATRQIEHTVTVGAGRSARSKTTYDDVNPYHKAWIAAILEKGADSPEAKGARLLVEERRETTDLKGLDSAIHSGKGDAREDGGYNEKERQSGAAEALEERKKILLASEQARVAIEGGTAAKDVKEIEKRLIGSFSKNLAKDPTAKDVAVGMIGSEAGDRAAVMKYAIEHEKKDLALLYLKRMDRREIDAFVTEYNKKNGNGPSLYARLGIFKKLGTGDAVFDGDDANELEIAFMGVPQNDKERGEVALRVMNQTIDQSGALGRTLANEEFTALVNNANRLKEQMGIDDANIDELGRIRTKDAQGNPITLGHFDAKGNLLLPDGGDVTPFEMAVAMARVTSTAYTQATDRIANFLTTALMVVAAILTTVLTGGAAASIWIAVLVTAGAGLIGMGLTYAIKGDRYTRDEMLRDLATTIVQAATAGIGAAAGAALRGGAPALKALAGSMRMSEQALGEAVAKAAGKSIAEATVLRSLSLAEEVAIGAGTSALSGGAIAALDPAARRGDDYWGNIFHAMGRGALGGGLGALGARAGTKGFEFVSKQLGSSVSQTAMKAALAAGKSEAEAIRAGEEAIAKHWATEIGTRAFSSGASGMASRGGELMYDKHIRGMDISYGEMLREMGEAGLQNFIQGAGEGAADRGMRAISPSRAAEHEWVQQQHALGHPPDRHDADPGVELATELAAASHIPTEAAAAPRTEPAARPEAGGTVTARPREAGEPPRSILARPELTEAPGPSPLRAPGSDEPVVFHSNRPGAERPGAGMEEEPVVFRSNRKDGDSERPAGPRPAPDEEKTNPNIRILTLEQQIDEVHANAKPGVAERQISPVFATADLSQERLKGLAHPVPEGSEIRATDPTSLAAALHNYRMLQEYTPHLEVLLAYNPESGHYVVVQGGPDSVKPPGSSWVTLRHAHPEVYDVTSGQLIVHHLPSGRPGDFSALMHEATIQAGRPENGGRVFLESIIDVHHGGEVRETRFSVTHDQGQVELRVTFRNPADNTEEHLGPFKSIQEYSDKVYEITGERITVDARAAPGRYSAPEDVGVRRGAPVSVEERGAARSIAQSVAEAAGLDAPARAGRMSEIHEMVRAMGLVGKADSLARLTNLLNVHDDDFTPAMRAAVASATLEATRAELVRTGALEPGDDVLMLFRGVPSERMRDYEKAGIDLSKIGPGGDEDAGRGLYGSQDFESALRYTGSDGEGQVLPLIVRRSELRNVIDVRSGTPLGDRWLEFIRASRPQGRLLPGYEHLNRMLDPRFDLPIAAVRDGRGQRFEAFLNSIKDDPTLPDGVRAAAADPHLTLMDLGGVASTGNDRGILTDQWAMHSQHIADLFNEAHGFPRVTRESAAAEVVPEPEPVMRSALTPKKPAPVVTSDEDNLGGGPALEADETPALVTAHPEHARIEATLAGAVGKDPAGTEIVSLLLRMTDVDPHLLAHLLVSPPHQSMEKLSAIATDLRQKGYSGERLDEILRQVAELKGRTNERLRIAFEHPLNIAAHADAINALSPVKQALVRASPVALHLMLSNATTRKNVPVFEHYARLFAKKGLPIGDGSAFETFVWNSVTHSKDPGITGLRSGVERLRTSFAGYRDALGPAVEAVRLLSNGQVDLSRPSLVNWPTSNFEGLVPYHPDDAIVPGTRIDHVDFGRGTIIGVANGMARISFDNVFGPATLQEIPLADLSLFHVRNGKTDQPEPLTPILGKPQQNAFQGKIDDYRQQKGLPAYVQDDGPSGTVSICRAGDQEFYGTNITLSSALQHFTPQERNALIPLLRTAGISLVEHADSKIVFQTHAEAASLLEARQKFGSGMPEVVELFVDRPTCWDCSANLSRLAEYLGIRELRIYYRNQSDSPTIVKGRAR